MLRVGYRMEKRLQLGEKRGKERRRKSKMKSRRAGEGKKMWQDLDEV